MFHGKKGNKTETALGIVEMVLMYDGDGFLGRFLWSRKLLSKAFL